MNGDIGSLSPKSSAQKCDVAVPWLLHRSLCASHLFHSSQIVSESLVFMSLSFHPSPRSLVLTVCISIYSGTGLVNTLISMLLNTPKYSSELY